MKRSVLGIIIAVVALGAIGVILLTSDKDKTTPVDSTLSSNTTNNDMNNMDMNPVSENNISDEQATASNTVSIENFAFGPSKITVKKGTSVTWTNKDSDRHDVTPDDSSEAFEGSELLSKGESYSFTFNTVGTYTYYCSPHPYMKGTVEVTE